MHETGVKILEAAVGIRSNRGDLLPCFPQEVCVESLLTDFHKVERLPSGESVDGTITVLDEAGAASGRVQGSHAFFKGPFAALEREAADRRYTLWGNQGFLYRFALALLEKEHRIHSLHACGLLDPEEKILYLVTGGAGAGKTVFLLRGLQKGMKLFSTETVHFRIESGSVTWFMGSLVDNVRVGTLARDFPGFPPGLRVSDRPGAWLEKTAVDLSAYRAGREVLENPGAVHVLFPRVERGFPGTEIVPVTDGRETAKRLFDNISQKIAETFLLCGRLPVPGLDRASLARRRLRAVEELTGGGSIVRAASVITNPKDCWKGILE